jgi:hypothetical protein
MNKYIAWGCNVASRVGDRRTAGFRSGLCPLWVISVENDQGRSSVYVRSTPKS